MTSLISQMGLGSVNIVQDDAYLGTIREFMDKNHADPSSVALESGTLIRAIYVYNDSGGTLAKSLGLSWKAANAGKKVDALSGANLICDGVVDPFLSAAVPIAGYFWMILSGPIDVEIGAGDITTGALVQTLASGKFGAGTPGTNPIGHCGEAIEAAASGARARVMFNPPFRSVH
jgi:hypothetical protein